MSTRISESYKLDEGIWRRGRNRILGLALLSWTACAAGAAGGGAQFGFSYLTGFLFAVTIALGGLFFVMLQHLTGSVWSVTMRRVMERIMATLPVAAVLFLPVAFGAPGLYVWVREAAELGDKRVYLTQNWFLIRAALYFALWSLWAIRLYRMSLAEDRGKRGGRPGAWSAPGMVMLTVTITMAATDWLMSLEPRWTSTMFGVYVFSGAAVVFVAALILVLLAFRGAGLLRESVTLEHYHDLGKWLFAFTVFWAYIAFCQYLLIWYANIPEETVWFRERLQGGWQPVGLLLVAGHFLAPFFVLISRAAKRNLRVLGAAAAWMLLMHYAELYWLVMPVLHHGGPAFHWLDLAALLAPASTLALMFWWGFRTHALVPVGDWRLERALDFKNV